MECVLASLKKLQGSLGPEGGHVLGVCKDARKRKDDAGRSFGKIVFRAFETPSRHTTSHVQHSTCTAQDSQLGPQARTYRVISIAQNYYSKV